MKSSTLDIHHEKVNETIDYISFHLHEELKLDALALVIGVSQRQLLRMMRENLGEPLAAYIARQRMERAVMYMQAEPVNLMVLSEKVGYDNPQSFSKAFKKQFGISPKSYLANLQKRLSERVGADREQFSGLHVMLCELGQQEFVYIRVMGKYGDPQPYVTAWDKLVRFLKENSLLDTETRFAGISFDDPNVTRQCRFYACASVQGTVSPRGEFGKIRVPAGRYAVYTYRGSYDGLQAVYDQLQVCPGFLSRHGIAYEEYLNNPRNTREEDLITKIYIPAQ